RGVFRSTDGGKTWEKVLYKDEKTGAIDVSFVPGNAHTLFAAMWEAGRTPWSLTSGGPGSGLYKSIDDGTTWKKIEGNGFPSDTVLGKIGVSVSGADPNRVYVILEALEERGGFYRSDDGGTNWRQMTDDHRLRQRPWYYTHVIAHPKELDTLFVLNTSMYRSTDGGRNWTPVRGIPHGDHHGLWIDPNFPQRMINANDGGATITVDNGKTWSRQDNQPTAQFYHVATDNQFPYNLYGSQQDNSSVRIASRGGSGGIDRHYFTSVGGGEAGYISPDPHDPNIVYAGEYFGILTRWDATTGQAQNIMVWPDDLDGHEAAAVKYRFNWTEPIVASKHNPGTVYYAGNSVFKTTNGGMSWAEISPDLTRNDKSKQGRSGGPITGENITIEYYNVVFSLAESPIQKNMLWAGADDGLVNVTRDEGKTWTNVTPRDWPEGIISQIDPSPHSAESAYVAMDRHKFDDFTPYIYKTHDGGKSWTRINNGIPNGTFVRAVRVDPKRKGLLFAGTEMGVYVSFNDGDLWQPLQLNLPVAPVNDLVVKDDDLVLATHGRSFWILDDISPLRQMSAAVAAADAHLFNAATALRWRPAGGFGRGFAGENPPNGAVLYYYLKADAKEEIKLEILDKAGKLVRKYSSAEKRVEGAPRPEGFEPERPPDRLPVKAGLTRFVWDLRHETPTLLANAIYDMGQPNPPMAVPGSYTARLTVAGKQYTAPIEVKLDPRVKTSPADLQKQLDFSQQVWALLGDTHEGAAQMRDLRTQMQALVKRIGQEASGKEVSSAATALIKKMDPLEAELIEVKAKASQDMCNYPTKLNSKIAYLTDVADSADTPPNKQSLEFYAELRGRADTQLKQWRDIMAKD
ncbi:MAG: glycosyl hydrolase, partial [Acidobacteria bacterium]|nr:glycosyl hydrolase [Acidobacteriota bacterium]